MTWMIVLKKCFKNVTMQNTSSCNKVSSQANLDSTQEMPKTPHPFPPMGKDEENAEGKEMDNA
jgi:hypothetical protein